MNECAKDELKLFLKLIIEIDGARIKFWLVEISRDFSLIEVLREKRKLKRLRDFNKLEYLRGLRLLEIITILSGG